MVAVGEEALGAEQVAAVGLDAVPIVSPGKWDRPVRCCHGGLGVGRAPRLPWAPRSRPSRRQPLQARGRSATGDGSVGKTDKKGGGKAETSSKINILDDDSN